VPNGTNFRFLSLIVANKKFFNKKTEWKAVLSRSFSACLAFDFWLGNPAIVFVFLFGKEYKKLKIERGFQK